MLPEGLTIIDIPLSEPIAAPRPPRWRCRRPGLWCCTWLGRHYASARRHRDGWWRVDLFLSGKRASYWPFPSLRALRAELAAPLRETWKLRMLDVADA